LRSASKRLETFFTALGFGMLFGVLIGACLGLLYFAPVLRANFGGKGLGLVSAGAGVLGVCIYVVRNAYLTTMERLAHSDDDS